MDKKDFDAKRLALMDLLRRDRKKTTATRIVGLEIIAGGNSVTCDSWKSQTTIVKQTGVPLRTVKRAIAKLDGEYFRVSKDGRANRYRLNFALLACAELPLDEDRSASVIGAKTSTDRCQNEHAIGAKTAPLSLKENSFTTLQAGASLNARAVGDAQGGRERNNEEIIGKRNDGATELKAAKLIGPDGFDVLAKLNEIDRGQPRLRLLRLVESERVTDADLQTARLAACSPRQPRNDRGGG